VVGLMPEQRVLNTLVDARRPKRILHGVSE